MPEREPFETRFSRAYRRYLDEVPTEVDALEVARTAATQRRFRLSWPRIVGPARALVWVVLLALLLAALAASTLLTGSQPAVLVSPTEVSGTSPCTQTESGQWHGAYVLGGVAERLSGMTQECTMEASDPRLAGDVENVVDCNYADVDGVLVGECWGTSVIRNENGAWGGVFSGTTRNELGSEDVMDLVYLGSGDYAGLRFVGSTTTTLSPNRFTGTIESVE
jgi:hypothetical protein